MLPEWTLVGTSLLDATALTLTPHGITAKYLRMIEHRDVRTHIADR